MTGAVDNSATRSASQMRAHKLAAERRPAKQRAAENNHFIGSVGHVVRENLWLYCAGVSFVLGADIWLIELS